MAADRIRVGGHPVQLLRQSNIDSFLARYVLVDNTFEVYYPMMRDVPSFDAVSLRDKEPYGRLVQLFDEAQVQRMRLDGLLTPAAAAMWDDARAHDLTTSRW